MGWRRVLRNYFTFNRRERRGVIVLLILLCAVLGTQLWLRFTPSSVEEMAGVDPSTVFIHDARVGVKSEDDSAQNQSDLDNGERKRVADWHPFDPNSVSEAELLSFGLDQAAVHRWSNYRNKGGRFYSANDVFKLYGIDSAWVMEAIPHMDIPTTRIKREFSSKDRPQKTLIDLNRADTNDLKSIRGVGGFYAREVIQLRERLGGFFSFDQLLEVYRMRDETLTNIAEHSFIDTTAVTKININTCSVDPLGRHPYLGWKRAKVVVSFRQQHGPYAGIEEIKKTKVVGDSVYRKIAPYLTVK
ncbi:MAG: helix-hairpin-helix domain-containing protein [Cryomorphaceae bacterium]